MKETKRNAWKKKRWALLAALCAFCWIWQAGLTARAAQVSPTGSAGSTQAGQAGSFGTTQARQAGGNGAAQEGTAGSSSAAAQGTVSGNTAPGANGSSLSGNAVSGPYRTVGLSVSDISYGQPLSASRISCDQVILVETGEAVEGAFHWVYPNEILNAGTAYQSVAFVPDQRAKNLPSVTFLVTVHINPAQVSLTLPTLRQNGAFCYGDLLTERFSIEGGSAAFLDPEKGAEIPVAGTFAWEEPDVLLEAGTHDCRLIFTPKDTTHYAKTAVEVKNIQVQPRSIGLTLSADKTRCLAQQKVKLTALASNLGNLEQLEGTIGFVIEGKVWKDGLSFEKKEETLSVTDLFEPEKDGIYRISAVYTPEDGNTQKLTSRSLTLRVGDSLSAITTEALAEGKEGEPYQAALETDAAKDVYELSFALTKGSLPDGLLLDGKKGTISGTPKEAGLFSFTIEASDGEKTASRDYELLIRAKEPIALTISCNDIFYGQAPSVKVEAESGEPLEYECTYEGAGDTVYGPSQEAPQKPGSYRVEAVLTDPAAHRGQSVSGEFSIGKATPHLKAEITPARLEGGGEVELSITVENPYRSDLKEGLAGSITATWNRDVDIQKQLSGSEGVYSQKILLEEEGTYLCLVRFLSNDYYQSAQQEIRVVVTKASQGQTGSGQGSGSQQPQTGSSQQPQTGSQSGTSQQASDSKNNEKEPVVKTPEEVEADFWQDIIFRIYRAQENGDTVTIQAKGHSQMPDKVMEALRTHTKVTLALVWEGDMIVIPGSKAAAAQKGKNSWSLTELSQLYPLAGNGATGTSPSDAQSPAGGSGENVSANPAHGGQNPSQEGGSSGSNLILHTGTPETQESEAVEETEQASEEVPSSEAEPIPVESVEQPEALQRGEIDWFLVAVWICAGAGVLAVGAAGLSLVLRKKR